VDFPVHFRFGAGLEKSIGETIKKEKTKTICISEKNLKPADPLAKAGSHFLAHDDMMMQVRHGEVYLQLYFFVSLIAFYKTYVDDILPVHAKENTRIQLFIQIRQVFIGDIFFAV
jgi:hypothetical protein